MVSNIQYRYALDDEGQLIEIKDAESKNKKFICPHCKSEMIKRCGNIKVWHFAHKKKKCDYNKYLHTVAEIKIADWFNSSEHVYLEYYSLTECPKYADCKLYKRKCNKKNKKKIDLKAYFRNAQIEKVFYKNNHKFVADIFCENNKDKTNPLFIEICVTHQCEPQKIDSKIKIIEFLIKSESDIESIINNPIKRCEYTIFHNFIPQKESATNTSDTPQQYIQKFILFPSMKAHIEKDIECHKLQQRRGIFELSIHYDLDLEDCTPSFFLSGGFYKVAFAVANKYLSLKSCYLCKYQKYSDWDSTNICTLYKKYGTNKDCLQNNANDCPYFRMDIETNQERIKAFEKYKKSNPIDLWINEDYTQQT